jgi:beta-glucosidase
MNFYKQSLTVLTKSTVILFIITLNFNLYGQNVYKKSYIDFNKNGKKDPYEDPKLDINTRVDNLVSLMTLDEKTAQMVTLYGYGRVLKDELPTPEWKKEFWKDGIGNIDEQLNNTTFNPQTQTKYSYPYSNHGKAINQIQKWFIEETRLGIPVDFTIEGIRGLGHDRATCFPANIGTGSTWDKNLVHEMGKVIGREAKVLGYTNVYAPILDLARDPRWGRTLESMGEDPFLVGSLGMEEVNGIQSNGVASTVKHYAVYSAPKGGRDGDVRTDPHITWREMQNIYLYPFKKAFRDAGALGTMSSYNDYDGLPITGSDYFLTIQLRQRFKFKGYVVSDSDAVEYLYRKHHVASNYKDGIRQAVEAGLNIRTTFTPPEVYGIPLREDVLEGAIPEQIIDQRVKEILRVKMMLRLFDKPLVEFPDSADLIVHSANHTKIARQISHESIVLLKNDSSFLPLKKEKLKSILVTGPNAAAVKHSMSRYGPNNIDIISVLSGLQNKVGDQIEIKYTQGCNIKPENWLELELIPEPPAPKEQSMIDSAVLMAKSVDLAIVVLGDDPTTVGESYSRTSLNLPGFQEDLLKAVYATGTPVLLVLLNGRPVTINWADKYISAIVEGWFPGEFGGEAIANVLFGDYNPGGKLPVTFPKTVGQIPYNFPYKPASQAGQGGHKSRVLEPLYPFGYGLSYTRFKYANLIIDTTKQDSEGIIEVKAHVTNTGKMVGDEVVQMYMQDLVSSVTVYEKQLRGFERIHLNPGETKQVVFQLDPEDLSLINKEMNRVVEPGDFKILVGSSSVDIRLEGNFSIRGGKFCELKEYCGYGY